MKTSPASRFLLSFLSLKAYEVSAVDPHNLFCDGMDVFENQPIIANEFGSGVAITGGPFVTIGNGPYTGLPTDCPADTNLDLNGTYGMFFTLVGDSGTLRITACVTGLESDVDVGLAGFVSEALSSPGETVNSTCADLHCLSTEAGFQTNPNPSFPSDSICAEPGAVVREIAIQVEKTFENYVYLYFNVSSDTGISGIRLAADLVPDTKENDICLRASVIGEGQKLQVSLDGAEDYLGPTCDGVAANEVASMEFPKKGIWYLVDSRPWDRNMTISVFGEGCENLDITVLDGGPNLCGELACVEPISNDFSCEIVAHFPPDQRHFVYISGEDTMGSFEFSVDSNSGASSFWTHGSYMVALVGFVLTVW